MDQPTPNPHSLEGSRGKAAAPSYHEPVMLDDVLAYLAPAAEGWIVDGTFGGGGHSHALLDRFPLAHVVGIDRDPDALGQATRHPRLHLIEGNVRNLPDLLAGGGLPQVVDGILLDLGVSSHQLDVPSRGFSYREDGPLDMRMGRDADRTAADIVNGASVDDLTHILRSYGEERFAHRIATAIVSDRPFSSTTQLARCVAEAVPAAARRSRHPARKTFQALRIAVNDELGSLSDALAAGISCLDVGGRFVVMAYHSLEDRIVKRSFADHARTCTCPPGLPTCVCGASPDLTLITRKPVRPSAAEIAANPRARSAVLRVAERITP